MYMYVYLCIIMRPTAMRKEGGGKERENGGHQKTHPRPGPPGACGHQTREASACRSIPRESLPDQPVSAMGHSLATESVEAGVHPNFR